MMKRAFLAAALVACTVLPAVAQTHSDSCVSAHDLVVTIAKARDNGMPLSNALRIIDQNYSSTPEALKLWRTVVITVYSTPTETPVRIAGTFLEGCMRAAKGV